MIFFVDMLLFMIMQQHHTSPAETGPVIHAMPTKQGVAAVHNVHCVPKEESLVHTPEEILTEYKMNLENHLLFRVNRSC